MVIRQMGIGSKILALSVLALVALSSPLFVQDVSALTDAEIKAIETSSEFLSWCRGETSSAQQIGRGHCPGGSDRISSSTGDPDNSLDPADNPLGAPIDLSGDTGTDCDGIDVSVDVNCTDAENPILAYIGGISKFLAAGIGIIIVLALVLSSIQYITAQDNPQQLSSAKSHIWNVIIALMAYIFMFAFLQWLVPGGVF